MKIIIAGGGKVGKKLVQKLSHEGHDITLIDTNHRILEEMVNNYDVMAVQGNCASAPVLREAQIESVDLLIAAIRADEINLLCCMTAHKLNPNLHTIARIRNPEYKEQVYEMKDTFALSMVVNPEARAAREAERLLRLPGFLRREAFAKDQVEIVELRINKESKLCNQPMTKFSKITGVKVLVSAVIRKGTLITPDGNFVFEDGDRIFMTAQTSSLTTLLSNIGIITKKVRSVIICGGSRIAYHLAKRLTKANIRVTIVEKEADHCVFLAESLPNVTIIHGDATDPNLMESAGLRSADALITLTSLDEMNLIISMHGNSIGVSNIITKVGHLAGSPIVNELPIGSIINPVELTSNAIVRYIRAMSQQTAAALSVHSIADGMIEAEEYMVDEKTRYCGVALKNLNLKKGVLIVCIMHGSEIIIPDGDSKYEAGDHVIIVTEKGVTITKFNDIFGD